MDCWMTDERLDITRKYVHDMINSFVDDPKGTNYHNEYNPPYMMINSPDLQHLLVKSCYDDKYIVKHGEVGGLAEFRDFNNNIYDIDGHRVWTLGGGTIDIYIDGVAFDQFEMDRLKLYVGSRRLPGRGEASPDARKTNKVNRFKVKLPPK